MSYLILSSAFCFAWCLAAWNLDRTKYPVFGVWLWSRALQAVGMLIAGAHPPARYTNPWMLIEALSLITLLLSLRELVPRRMARLCAIGGALAVASWFLYPMKAHRLALEFARVRECIWMALAVALIGNLILLALRPISSSPKARRVWYTVAGYAVWMAVTGWPLAGAWLGWLNVRAVYMTVTALFCMSWADLLPSLARSAVCQAAGELGVAGRLGSRGRIPRLLPALPGLAAAAVVRARPQAIAR